MINVVYIVLSLLYFEQFYIVLMNSLLLALDELMHGVEQNTCVRYLYNNFKKRYKEKKLKEIKWKMFWDDHKSPPPTI